MLQNTMKIVQLAVIRRLLLLILGLALSQITSAAHAADAVILGMAGFNFSFLPFHVAMERGFYQKHGLSVKPVLMRSQAAIPALVSGDIDYATHFGSIVRGAVRGLPMRVILSTADRQMFSLVVQPEIKTLENLKGKIIGVSSFGGTQQTVTVGVLRAVYRLLAPGGRVVIVTDNAGSPDFVLFGGRHWGGYHFPRHFHLFTRRKLTMLAAAAGLTVDRIVTPMSPVNWVYSVRNWLDDWGATRWLVNRFSLTSVPALAAFTLLDLPLALLGRGAILRAVFRRPAGGGAP